MAPGSLGTGRSFNASDSLPKSGKRKLLDDSDSESDDGGAPLAEGAAFKVNEEFARRFEHNKKRAERQKLEEKYKDAASRRGDGGDEDDSSSDETEDEDGFLATEDLDAQISATLHAIRNKDPRVYDKNTNFFQSTDGTAVAPEKEKKEKPVFLRDYHREKLLRGDMGASDDEDEAPQTYAQEQDALQKTILSEINAAGDEEASDDDGDDDVGFMKRKEPKKLDSNGVHPSRSAALKITDVDVANAEKNPENFLSNFLASRAWAPQEGLRWEPFESDEGEGDDKADEWEQAYNLRFEDPEKSNEVLKSYARDVTAARSVRREDKTSRKRHRELEREQKEEEKRERHEEKARLRKLKLEEAEGKLRKIRHAAGASGKHLTDEEWMKFLDDAWENEKWEEEMKRRFGDEYYAVNEGAPESDEDEDVAAEPGAKKKKIKPKKPTWDDDIDIKDIIPDFVEEEEANPGITLSDTEAQDDDGEAEEEEDDDEEHPVSKKRKTSDHKRARIETRKKARQERTKIEALVDSKIELTNHDLLRSSGHVPFRYRETSPQSFGMTPRDILLAPSDKELNEFAGLKKLATFRDEEKKRRDKKRLGKKARLRQWRRDVFGSEFERTGPTYGFERVVDADADIDAPPARLIAPDSGATDGGNIVGDVGGARKKKKRSKGKKGATAEA